jgi:hypothetical protein
MPTDMNQQGTRKVKDVIKQATSPIFQVLITGVIRCYVWIFFY